MSTVTVKTALTNSDATALTNDVDGIIESIKTLVKTYIPGIPAQNIFKGVRTLGDEDAVKLPCLMLQMRSISPTMPTTGKINKKYPVDCVFYIGNENAEAADVAATSMAAILIKLFSNNALNDAASGAPTGSFKSYNPNWNNSDMSRVEISPVFKFAKGNGPKYVVIGFFRLTLERFELA